MRRTTAWVASLRCVNVSPTRWVPEMVGGEVLRGAFPGESRYEAPNLLRELVAEGKVRFYGTSNEALDLPELPRRIVRRGIDAEVKHEVDLRRFRVVGLGRVHGRPEDRAEVGRLLDRRAR